MDEGIYSKTSSQQLCVGKDDKCRSKCRYLSVRADHISTAICNLDEEWLKRLVSDD